MRTRPAAAGPGSVVVVDELVGALVASVLGTEGEGAERRPLAGAGAEHGDGQRQAQGGRERLAGHHRRRSPP
ncbi:MAG: hypothetical protein R2711_05070 [Acidimicrobiales bacterium]